MGTTERLLKRVEFKQEALRLIYTDKPLRPRPQFDVYPTDRATIASALSLLPADFAPRRALDPGAGDGGPWGTAIKERWPACRVDGCDIRALDRPPAFAGWASPCDYRQFAAMARGADLAEMGCAWDLIATNGPYGDLSEVWVRESLSLLAPSGVLILLLPLRFLESVRRRDGLWAEHPPASVHVLGRRPSFVPTGACGPTAYAIYLWTQGVRGPTSLHWL